MDNTLQSHWDNTYLSKGPDQLSWSQNLPEPSLSLIKSTGITKTDAIIDIGGGDATLIENLLSEGYSDLTVLDISSAAIDRARKRLGERAEKIKWIVCNILDFAPARPYKLWHDRATFHFLTETQDIKNYKHIVSEFVDKDLIIGTFSENGPTMCSGLPVRRYNLESLELFFNDDFQLKQSVNSDHVTPFGSVQNFLFTHFFKGQLID
ncbi:class I SAM-dependent methyltransferase [Dyadobacter luticola]|uniref:Class I SAM-dependent methyltransferase n=2 Tax=Dyadobacter luticola TaxID=1979387 RepID=A0A5R9KZT8_9BACT|nr:class I SAM-dependent methyltransferase [Dyadobacter luticola]